MLFRVGHGKIGARGGVGVGMGVGWAGGRGGGLEATSYKSVEKKLLSSREPLRRRVLW